MAILSKSCKPDNFESHNLLKLSFTNIRDLCSNFVDCESFLNQTLLTFLLCVRQTYSGNFSGRGYLPLIRKGFSTHMHGLAVDMKEGMRFSRSTHLLMFLSLETLTSIIRTGLPILVELVKSFIIFYLK